MLIHRYWSAILAIVVALLMSTLTAAAWISQEPEEPPGSEEQRKEVLERLIDKVREAEQDLEQPPAAAQQPQTVPPASNIVQRSPLESGKVQLSYENADLYDFINQIASTIELTPIVIDPEVKGTVTIQSSQPMSKEDILPLFNLILKNNNAALIKQGGIYQIVPISSALKRGIEIIEHLPQESQAKSESETKPERMPKTAPKTENKSETPPSSDRSPVPNERNIVQASPRTPFAIPLTEARPPGAQIKDDDSTILVAAAMPNIIDGDRTAWQIAGRLYRDPGTVYVFPNGSRFRGDAIQDWGKIPKGTEVFLTEQTKADFAPLPQPVAVPLPQQQATVPLLQPQAADQNSEAEISGVPRLATHVIHVEFVPVRDLIEPIKIFMTEGGVIMPYERLNMLIITDYTDSVAKILEIVQMLDNEYMNPDLIELVKIENNASADVVEDLKKIFGSGAADSATGISFVSLDRLNAILVMANSKRGLGEVRRWIKELDATTGRNVQTFIYTVENSTASNIAMILSALYGGDQSTVAETAQGSQAGGLQRGSVSGGGMFGGGADSTAGGTSAGPFSAGTSGYQSGSTFQGGLQGSYQGGYAGGYGIFTGGQQLGPRLNAAPTISSQILRGGVFAGLQDEVRMVVDDINNSLIIQATAADYAYLLETIKKMDVLPRQALIDARIFEVDITNIFTFGVSASLQALSEGEKLTTAAIDSATGALSANTFALVGNSREILMALDALRQKTNVKILEAPSVLALDGMVAQIVVGSEIPYPGSSYTAPAGGSTTSVQYRETGITLLVRPRISASGSVTLEVAQEVSSPGAPTPTGPTFSKASVSTTLSVKDGETVAIAGLIRDSDSRSRSGVPFFSEIPILGSLFGRTSRTANRSELIILITPHVIRTPEKFQEMTQELQDSLRNVRKLMDDQKKEHIENMEDAREERYQEEQKRLKEIQPSNP